MLSLNGLLKCSVAHCGGLRPAQPANRAVAVVSSTKPCQQARFTISVPIELHVEAIGEDLSRLDVAREDRRLELNQLSKPSARRCILRHFRLQLLIRCRYLAVLR